MILQIAATLVKGKARIQFGASKVSALSKSVIMPEVLRDLSVLLVLFHHMT